MQSTFSSKSGVWVPLLGNGCHFVFNSFLHIAHYGTFLQKKDNHQERERGAKESVHRLLELVGRRKRHCAIA